MSPTAAPISAGASASPVQEDAAGQLAATNPPTPAPSATNPAPMNRAAARMRGRKTSMVRVYLITPPEGNPLPAVEAALAVLPRGAAAVQLRQALPARELLARARALRDLCTWYTSPLLVNDRADVA